MDAVSLGFSALAIVSILAVTVLLGMIERRVAPGEWARTVLVAGTGAAIVAVACSIQLLLLPLLLVGPLAALGALFATLATSLLESQSMPKRLVIAGAATALVFLPVASTVFGTPFDPFGTQLGVIDLGGGLPTLVAGGAVAVGTAVIQRPPATVRQFRTRGWTRLVPPILAWAAGIGWLVGLELAADTMVPIIVVSALVIPAVATIAASVVERLRFRRTTVAGVVTGLLAGMAAAVPACAFVTPPLAVAIGVAAGTIGALLPDSLRAWPAAMLAVGAAISVVLIGAFGTNIGYIYTGQPELVFGQVFITLAAIAGGLVVGAGLGWLVLRGPSRQRLLPRR
jgi:ammonia channel protein AmtB